MGTESDFQTYAKSLGKHWWALMSCAVFTIIGVYAEATNKGGRWVLWAFLIAALFMFLVGSFLAWREQHRLVLAEQAKNARPEIKGEIKELHVEHEWGGTPPNCDCFVVLRAHLVNYSPAVSTIKDYRLSVTTESGSVYSSSSKLSTYFWQLAKEPVRQYDFTVGTRIIREEIPDLSRLLATVPLERGHGKEGWLAFCMKSQRTEDENMKPKAARLTMIDAFGGEHRVECSSPWETSGTIVERDL